ncbi:MAG TPA: class I SAM-dependent methyltransferase [Rhizomicrobium sp.]|nr:class I SAM-dependent methyltransferase [Rhizomicrobium sp.]
MLLNLSDAELVSDWDEAFTKRFQRYAEEETFLQKMSEEFAGRRVLSIGTGLGLHEIYYHLHGAELTCYDIVPSNLEVIKRVAAAKGAAGMQFILGNDPNHDLGGLYDVIFIYGSLMTMPRPLQRQLAERCLAALALGGSIILMLYTWEFASATCGWSSPDEFDPARFALASDPSVGAEHCPWSDWHDDERLLEVFANALSVARRQLWNQAWFVWYELRQGPIPRHTPFFQPALIAEQGISEHIPLTGFQPAEAAIKQTAEGVEVQTKENSFGYALVGPPFEPPAGASVNAILVDVDLHEGGLSLGLLDMASNAFSFAQGIWQLGRHQHVFTFGGLPERCQVIISNFRTGAPGMSRFVLHRLALLDRPALEAPKSCLSAPTLATPTNSSIWGRP